jgi:hypothetical protein
MDSFPIVLVSSDRRSRRKGAARLMRLLEIAISIAKLMFAATLAIKATQEPDRGGKGNLGLLSCAGGGHGKGMGSRNQDQGFDTQQTEPKGRYGEVFERAASRRRLFDLI